MRYKRDSSDGVGVPSAPDKSVQYDNAGSFGAVPLNTTATKKYLQQFSSGTPSFQQVADADLSVTDITTNNVTNTTHGFAPKSPGNATVFLNGDTPPAWAAVKDSDLVMQNSINTNDVTNAHHGFFPTLVADRVYYVSHTGVLTALALGASGTFLKSNGTTSAPSFAAAPADATAWHITGNSGTTAGTNFLGTIDSKDLVFKVNNNVAGQISDNSGVVVGLANNAIGYRALSSNGILFNASSYNQAFGGLALNVSTGQHNCAFGDNALSLNTTGEFNSGFGGHTGTTNVTGSNLSFIGYNADVSADGWSNSTGVGYNAVVTASNQLSFSDIHTTLHLKLNTPAIGDVLTAQDTSGNALWQTPTATASGHYTPTLTNVTNITSSTPFSCTYSRTGSIVTVYGTVGITDTLAVASQIDISLPIASNLGTVNDLNGMAQGDGSFGLNFVIKANTANDRASMFFTAVGVGGSAIVYFTFQYEII